MTRGIVVLACVCALLGGFYSAIAKWGIRHETLDLFDAARQRRVSVDIAERVDYAMKADAGLWKPPVAVISNGNTVRNTEYSFLANVFAASGYLVASIQQDLPSDPPLVTKVGLPYVGRLAVYKKGEANILFVLQQLKQRYPNAGYDHLTLVGHSNGGDTAMYFAQQHPQLVSKVITLDNLRVPILLSHKLKVLSFRSKDPVFKTDPDVLPTPQQAKTDGIDIVQTPFQHTWMSDRGPLFAKQAIQATLERFLGGADVTRLASIDSGKPTLENGMPLP
ncbi:alpha/beta fold hydrolase [Bradyrhizobium jicamae]|uniref:Alpha/beta fold hydrolase n=1 Tax=Bradyrhizobium jicamae TaxID=280332 RepID=A0ABS5FWX3_9BRAD|nr:alpha/beta fold hydrolase [Bradyrhizobium jicamae]MBR0801300.1 alpha/beta fold hydrolase [Bradyrhizobium jicamae]